MSTGGPLRQAIPVARSILWSPASEGAKRPGTIAFPVFFSQAALTAVHEHVATPARPGQGVLGFLIGDLCECASKALPFYELLGADSIRPDGKKRSFVTWRNYRAFSAATPRSTPAVKPPSEPKFTPAPPAVAPPKPADTHELKFLTAAEDMG